LNLKVVSVFDDLFYLSDGVDDVGEATAFSDACNSTLLEARHLGIESGSFDLEGNELAIPTAEDIGHTPVSWDQAHVAITTNKIDRFELLNEPAFAL
jgi:hypothetical protein